MSPIRPAILNLAVNGIAQVAGLGLGDPDIVALWFGESDLATPKFICDAAKQALDDGKTFYRGQRGILPLREAIRDFHKRTVGADIAVERISVPGAATLAIVTALQCLVETGDNVVIGGFIITGNAPRKTIVRAIGPSLIGSGITDALADPTLELRASDGSLIRANDNWKDTQQAEIEATGVPQPPALTPQSRARNPAAPTAAGASSMAAGTFETTCERSAPESTIPRA